MNLFERQITRNCRRFFKRHYRLRKAIDQQLVNLLDTYGFVEVFEFSKYSDLSLDAFKIKTDDLVEIEGNLKDDLLMVTIHKSCPSYLNEIESTINKWTLQSKQTAI